MAEGTLEVARRVRDAWIQYMRGEIDAESYAAHFDPEVEVRWHDSQIYPDTPQRLVGVTEALSFTEAYRAGWSDLDVEWLEVIDAPDDRVLSLVRQSARGRESGVPIEIHFFQLYTIRNGKVREIEYFRHRADALRAAGLEA